MRRFVCVVISIVMVFVSFTFSCRAAFIDDTVNPLIYTPCTGGNGICQMKSYGWVNVYDIDTKELLLEDYSFWQCVNCYTGMATEGDPKCGIPIGRYVFCAYHQFTSSVYNVMYVDPDRINYTSSTSIEGYAFVNS